MAILKLKFAHVLTMSESVRLLLKGVVRLSDCYCQNSLTATTVLTQQLLLSEIHKFLLHLLATREIKKKLKVFIKFRNRIL